MTILRALTLAVLTLAACEKPPATEAPTTATPEGGDDGAATTPETPPAGECHPTGCSATVCADEDVVTTCEFRPEYACYKSATCARQDDGACGWTKSAELDACLADPPKE